MAEPRTASSFLTYIDTVLNLNSAETENANKRVDAAELLKECQNFYYAGAVRRAIGEDCTESNATNGVSVNLQTNLTLFNEQGGQGIGENGNYAMVFDTTAANVWWVSMPADDEVSFAQAQLVDGNKAAGYNNAAFIDGLEIYIYENQPKWNKNCLDLDFNHVDHLSAEDLPHSIGVAITTKTTVDNQIAAFLSEHEAAGIHKDGALKSEYLEADTFKEEGGENLLRNPGFEWYPQGAVWTAAFHNLPQDWVLFNVPTAVGPETTIVRADDFSCRVVAGGADQGIQQSFANFARFQGRYVTVAVSLYTTVDNTVVVGIKDTVAPGSFEADVIPMNTWTRKTHTILVNAAATELTVTVKSTNACTYYIDEIILCAGKVPSALVDSTSEQIAQARVDLPAVNFLYNSLFDDWDNGVGVLTYPNLWSIGVGAPFVFQQIAGAGNFKYGTYSYELTLFNNDGTKIITVNSPQVSQLVQQSSMIFSCWMKDGVGSQDEIRLRAAFVGAAPDVISNDIPIYSFANWTLVWFIIPQTNDVLDEIHIENMNGTAFFSNFLVDCCQLYMGDKPTKGILPSVWSHDIIHFNTVGASLGDAYLTLHDMATGKPVTLPDKSMLYSMAAEASAIGGGASAVELHINLVLLGGWIVGPLAIVNTLYTCHSGDILRIGNNCRAWLYFNHVVGSDCVNVAGYLTYLKLQL